MPALGHGPLTRAEYAAAEERSGVRHEFLGGYVFAMAGGTMGHAQVITNLTVIAGTALRGKPCRPYVAEQRIQVEATDLSTYPDLSIVCGTRIPAVDDRHAATNPTVLFEGLSESTANYDRGEKFEHYRQIPTLREYVLIESRRVHVDVYRLNAAGDWVICGYGPGERVPLRSVDIDLPVDELYEGWEPDEPGRLPTGTKVRGE